MAWTGRRALGGHFPAPASFDPAVRVFIGVVLLFAAGCAEPLAWSKPGGTSEGFAKDRYECFQEARVPYSGAYVNPYYGSSAGGIRIDDNLATACLEARGWRLASHAWARFDRGVTAYNRGDYAAALREFLPLAQQGYGPAQTNLGVMYETGRGVTQDSVQAHMWHTLAVEMLSPGKVRDIAVSNRDLVARKMTPAQLAEAQRLAREWKPKSGK